MASINRVINYWHVDEFPDASPDHLRTLNEITPDGIRYVPVYGTGSDTYIELQERIAEEQMANMGVF